MARSILSPYELVMLFYNCLTTNGRNKFKPLIEKYAILNNLRIDLLGETYDQELYKKRFQIDFNIDNNENVYHRGAFVFIPK